MSPSLARSYETGAAAFQKAIRGASVSARRIRIRESAAIGMNDGLIVPGTEFVPGTPPQRVRNEAALRAPLRGPVRVLVVLVEFPGKKMATTKETIEKLFFSEGTRTRSVKDYFLEVSKGQVEIVGEVNGPYRLPRPIEEYAGQDSGTGRQPPNARTMARDTALAIVKDTELGPFDNDRNGFVDAFVIVHAGEGAEQTGDPSDIWSHKWVVSGRPVQGEGARIYAYLTIPERASLGVSCHELGHLLFGWPDLYDPDDSSAGAGNWCLMAGGSWNGPRGRNGEIKDGEEGTVPAHPSAWCKQGQEWVSLVDDVGTGDVNIVDVKDGNSIYRVFPDGVAGPEYFLIENRQKSHFDAELPGEGLLMWHVDESIEDNSNEIHPKVALVQADAQRDLERNVNRGDTGDPYPGRDGNRSFTFSSNPSSRTYAGFDSGISVTGISAAAATMTARISVGAMGGGTRRGRRLRDLESRISAMEVALAGWLAEVEEGQRFDVSESRRGQRFDVYGPLQGQRFDVGRRRREGPSLVEVEARLTIIEVLLERMIAARLGQRFDISRLLRGQRFDVHARPSRGQRFDVPAAGRGGDGIRALEVRLSLVELMIEELLNIGGGQRFDVPKEGAGPEE